MKEQKSSSILRSIGSFFSIRILLLILLTEAILGVIWFAWLYKQTHLSPVELYHANWTVVQQYAFEQSKLKDWRSWEHRFDNQINTDGDAIKYANISMSLLGDHYARLLTSTETEAEKEQNSGHFIGIGIQFAVKTSADGTVLYGADKDAGPLAASDMAGNPLIHMILIDSPAQHAGLKAQDSLLKVNGIAVLNCTVKALHEAIGDGKPGDIVRFVVLRGGRAKTIEIARAEVKLETVFHKVLTAGDGTKIGYLRLSDFSSQPAPLEMLAAVKSLKASGADRLIVDIRSNPGGDIVNCLKIVSIFMQSGKVATSRMRDAGEYTHVLYEVKKDKILVQTESEGKNEVESKTIERLPALGAGKKITILTNHNTASAAEMFTAALQDNGLAVIVGERTFGKGIGQSVVALANGTSLHITSLRYFTPSGKWLGDGGNSDRSYGIVPDHVIKLNKNISEYGASDDNQLRFAVESLSENRSKRNN